MWENFINNNYGFAGTILALSILSYSITNFILSNVVSRFFKKTKTKIDDILIDNGLLNRLSYMIPLLVIYIMAEFKFEDIDFISRIIYACFTIVGLSAISSVLNSINEIYSKSS